MRFTLTPSTAVAAATALALASTLTACAATAPADDTTPPPTAEPTDPATSAEPAADPAEPTESADGIGDIPLPDGHMVVDDHTDEATGADTLLAHVPGEFENHAEFYRSELPAAGWEIVAEEPTESGHGTLFEVTSDTTRAWIQCENFDGGTALSISANALDAEVLRPGQTAGGSDSEGVIVDLPDGFPTDVALPLFAPSELVTGVDHGDDMWVLEYVAATDMATVKAGIDEDIALKDWTITDESPEGPGTKYELERSGYELILVIIPERTNDADTSLHYTLRSQ